jgi:hypothetical protein
MSPAAKPHCTPQVRLRLSQSKSRFGANLRAEGLIHTSLGRCPRKKDAIFSIRTESPVHILFNGAGFQPFISSPISFSWGVAPGWYGSAPLVLPKRSILIYPYYFNLQSQLCPEVRPLSRDRISSLMRSSDLIGLRFLHSAYDRSYLSTELRASNLRAEHSFLTIPASLA